MKSIWHSSTIVLLSVLLSVIAIILSADISAAKAKQYYLPTSIREYVDYKNSGYNLWKKESYRYDKYGFPVVCKQFINWADLEATGSSGKTTHRLKYKRNAAGILSKVHIDSGYEGELTAVFDDKGQLTTSEHDWFTDYKYNDNGFITYKRDYERYGDPDSDDGENEKWYKVSRHLQRFTVKTTSKGTLKSVTSKRYKVLYNSKGLPKACYRKVKGKWKKYYKKIKYRFRKDGLIKEIYLQRPRLKNKMVFNYKKTKNSKVSKREYFSTIPSYGADDSLDVFANAAFTTRAEINRWITGYSYGI